MPAPAQALVTGTLGLATLAAPLPGLCAAVLVSVTFGAPAVLMWAQQYKQYDSLFLFFIMDIGITDTIFKRDPRSLGCCYTAWIRRRELRHMNTIISRFKYLKWRARFRHFSSEDDVEPEGRGVQKPETLT